MSVREPLVKQLYYPTLKRGIRYLPCYKELFIFSASFLDCEQIANLPNFLICLNNITSKIKKIPFQHINDKIFVRLFMWQSEALYLECSSAEICVINGLNIWGEKKEKRSLYEKKNSQPIYSFT